MEPHGHDHDRYLPVVSHDAQDSPTEATTHTDEHPGELEPDDRVGPTRPGHGVVVVVRETTGSWCAAWFDLGSVEIAGDRDAVLAWARAQPAAEHLLCRPGLGDDMPLDSDEARGHLQG